MWDNPRLLNATANLLIGVAALLFAAAALQLLLRSPLFPLKEIVVRGDLAHASRAEIANAMDGAGGNFFAADLGAVRGRLEQVAWVRHVDARRIWPDRVEVRLEEHVAFARWGDSGLVNTFGEPFSAALDEPSLARLPLFAGPAGTEGELARRYRRFAEMLAPLAAEPGRAGISALVLTPRYAWQLRFADGAGGGLELELGRDGADPVEQRLARFVAAYPSSIGRLAHAGAGAQERGAPRRHVDLRYPNGFALRVAGWKG
jgi:cell division protein FtsQ